MFALVVLKIDIPELGLRKGEVIYVHSCGICHDTKENKYKIKAYNFVILEHQLEFI